MWNKSNLKSNIVIVKSKLNTLCKDMYLEKLKEFSKLSLYSSIKTNCNRETYLLKIINVNHRKEISQLRLSCHNLPIETGRYENLKRTERLCKLCKFKIGSEEHCLMECVHPNLTYIRNKYLNEIFTINSNLRQLPRHLLFKYLILFTDTNIMLLSASYIFDVLHVCK